MVVGTQYRSTTLIINKSHIIVYLPVVVILRWQLNKWLEIFKNDRTQHDNTAVRLDTTLSGRPTQSHSNADTTAAALLLCGFRKAVTP
jgi:hypothetical protein